ncbi:protein P21-like [Musa acuminata AAA Group]|uniref:protein P21-like n=1 Tax=Musa acuminata AAA Group TaxID=214697 RepID=UPI0031CE88FE
MASSTILSFLLFALLLALSRAATFEIVNGCPFTVWAAAVPGGGRQLDQGQTWVLDVNPGTTGGRIWARTGCSFDGSGSGSCQTGDCGGLLECEAYGSPPNTLAEFSLNQFNNMDFFDVSLLDGFNVPMEFSSCMAIRCSADINGRCPAELRTPGGCNNPCTVFKTDEYCCTSSSCGPTTYSKFFKSNCPDAYSYPKDDATSTFTCPGNGDYKVIFCPSVSSLPADGYPTRFGRIAVSFVIPKASRT